METIVITDHNFPDLEIEKKVFHEWNLNVVTAQADTPDEIISIARNAGADGLLVQYATVTEAVYEELPDLEVVAKYGIGTDNIDTKTASEHGVTVLNVPDYCQDEVAEHALGLLLACERNLSKYDVDIGAGEWDWSKGAPLYRLQGKTLGIVGCGRIGRRLIEKTRGFDFTYLVYDPQNPEIPQTKQFDIDLERIEFESLIKRSDFVSIHTPLTEETKNMFGECVFEQMKDSAVLINTARGPIVDTEALAEALDEGELHAAGLDVLPEEPPDSSPLIGDDNVVLTPHVAWYSEESLESLRHTIATDLARTLSGKKPINPVSED